MRSFSLLLLLALCAGAQLRAQNIPFDSATYAAWIDMRVGDGDQPVFWYCTGEIYTYPEGELVGKMVGVDMAKLLPVSPDSVVQLNRKIFLYLDKDTGEVLREVDGKPVRHIQYPYQQIAYVRENDRLKTWVTQGAGEGVRTIGPGYKTYARHVGDTYFFNAPIFLNFETPRGSYQAAENYDFIVHPNEPRTEDRYQLMWWRYGDLAAHYGQTKGTIQLVSYRIDSFADIPDPLRSYIEQEAPLWTRPPQDMAEIAKLQRGE